MDGMDTFEKNMLLVGNRDAVNVVNGHLYANDPILHPRECDSVAMRKTRNHTWPFYGGLKER